MSGSKQGHPPGPHARATEGSESINIRKKPIERNRFYETGKKLRKKKVRIWNLRLFIKESLSSNRKRMPKKKQPV